LIIEKIYADLKTIFKGKPERLKHIFGVRDTTLSLGKKYNLDIKKLEIISLLHDITKYYSKEENHRLIDSYFPDSAKIYEDYNEDIIHAFSAYVVAKKEYKINDGEILNSILYHTVGRPAMSDYEKIMFISDYIEPNRTYESCIKVRNLVEKSLDLAVFTAMDDSIKWCEERNIKTPLIAFEARHFYRNLLEDNK